MRKIDLTFLFLFVVSISFSQKNEIGISILNYSANKQNSELKDTIGYGKSKFINSFQPVITFNHINSKNVDLFVQAGYFIIKGNTLNKSTFTNNGEVVYSSASNDTRSFFVKFGVAKRYYFDKIILSLGVNIPLEIRFHQVLKTETNYYDSLLTHLEKDVTEDRPALNFITGINLHQSIYFNAFKNFYIGFDLNVGFQTSIINGKRTYSSTTDNYYNNYYNATVKGVKYKFAYSNSLNFQPVIGIRYLLPQKKIIFSKIL